MQHGDEKNLDQALSENQEAGELVEEVGEELDIDNLDLTVETVEERISPSETNVFDK